MKHRRVKHYGFEFRYDNNNVDKDKPLPAGMSSFFCYQVQQHFVKNQCQYYFYILMEFNCSLHFCDLITTRLLPIVNECYQIAIKIDNYIIHICLFQGIPAECLPILERCLSNKIIDILPDQLTVNQYESGQGWLLQTSK